MSEELIMNYTIIKLILGRMETFCKAEAMIAHVNPRNRHRNLPARLCTKWDCGPVWILYVRTTPGDGMEIKYLFTSSCRTGFSTLVAETPESSHHAMIVTSNQAKTRARQNPPYTRGGTEISTFQVRKNECKFSKPWVDCRWSQTFSHSNWIEWDSAPECTRI